MISSELKPYPAYKDSGAEWLGEVPAHWSMRRLRNIAEMRISNIDKHTREGESPVRLCNYVDVYKNNYIRSGMDFMKATATKEEVERFRLRSRDVLITKDSEAWNDIGVPALVQEVEEDVVSGYHLALLRPGPRHLDGEFLFHALQSRDVACQLHVQANGVTRYGLSHNAIKSVQLPIPPVPEQSAIARFLDHADRRIRRSIRAKEKLITLLEEQKQAIIHQAVTGRIDVRTGRPYPAYKPSGVKCLEDVPTHWELVRLKDVAQVQTGLTLGKDYGTRTISRPYLRVANVQTDRLDLDRVNFIDVPPSETERFTLLDGDVLMTEGGDIDKLGRGCIWNNQIAGCLHQNHIFAVRCDRDALNPEFLVRLTASQYGRAYFQLTAKQTTNLASTNSTTLRSFPILLPPLDDQLSILRAISEKAIALDGAVARAATEIDLLREYRTRLIADIVTGKLDVREAAASLPEEPDDPDAVEASG